MCGTDGATPVTALIPFDRRLYGTTPSIATGGGGTVFEVSPSGQERLVYTFPSYPNQVGSPADLLAVNGVLYGTTERGV
jgi:hypothetical protein